MHRRPDLDWLRVVAFGRLIHRTVTVITVYWLKILEVSPVSTCLLTVLSTFGGTWLICAWLVRPWPGSGLKP